MNAEIEKRKQALLEEYGIFDSPQELFEYIISKNKHAKGLDSDFKRDDRP